MNAAKFFLAFFWGAAACSVLCYGLAYRSADALLLSAALAPSLVVFLWGMFGQASLERRIKRLEARSEIAAEKRAVMQTDLSEVEHTLEDFKKGVQGVGRIQSTSA